MGTFLSFLQAVSWIGDVIVESAASFSILRRWDASRVPKSWKIGSLISSQRSHADPDHLPLDFL